MLGSAALYACQRQSSIPHLHTRTSHAPQRHLDNEYMKASPVVCSRSYTNFFYTPPAQVGIAGIQVPDRTHTALPVHQHISPPAPAFPGPRMSFMQLHHDHLLPASLHVWFQALRLDCIFWARSAGSATVFGFEVNMSRSAGEGMCLASIPANGGFEAPENRLHYPQV